MNPSTSRAKLALQVTSERCSRCKAGDQVACDGWKYVQDEEASAFYNEPLHPRAVRCEIYLKRYARECAEKAAAAAGLPPTFVKVLDPDVHPALSGIPPLAVIYPLTPCPQSAYQVVQTVQAAAWYHAQAGHQPWYLYVPGVTWEGLDEVRQRASEVRLLVLDRWDGGQLHPKLLQELCVILEARLSKVDGLMVSLLRPVEELEPRVPDEAVLIHRLQAEATRLGI